MFKRCTTSKGHTTRSTNCPGSSDLIYKIIIIFSIFQHIEPGLAPILDPSEYPRVIHGTYTEAWTQIRSKGGLNRMKRNHIHFATGRFGEDNVLSGMRADCDIFIYVDMKKALDGEKRLEDPFWHNAWKFLQPIVDGSGGVGHLEKKLCSVHF